MAEDPTNAQKSPPSDGDDGLVEGVEVELPPLFSREMVSDTRFLLIMACAVISGVFAMVVWLVGFEKWSLSVFLFTFNVLLISWFYFLVQHVRKQMEAEEEEAQKREGDVIHKSRKGVMSEDAAEGATDSADTAPKD